MPKIIVTKKNIKLNTDFGALKIYPTIQNLTVTPSSIEQVFTHPGIYGYDTVTVEAVVSDTLDIIPTNKRQEYTGLYNTVTVEKIPENEIDLSKSLYLIDWDGKLLKSYTTEEVQVLASLPANSGEEHEFLQFQEWNWSLADIKEYLRKKPCGHLVVGATYTTTDGQDHNYYEESRLQDKFHIYMIKTASTNFGSYGYSNRYKLKKINIPRGVTSFGVGIFSGCVNLNAIIIPNGVTTVAGTYSSTNMEFISVPKSLTNITSVTGFTIAGKIGCCWDNKISFSGNTLLKAVDILENVTQLPNYFCYNTINLDNIDIPETVESIGSNAFNTSSIIDIIIRSKTTLSALNSFNNTNNNLRIYVPRVNLSWFETATNWSTLYSTGKIVAVEDYLDYLESINMDVSAYRME